MQELERFAGALSLCTRGLTPPWTCCTLPHPTSALARELKPTRLTVPELSPTQRHTHTHYTHALPAACSPTAARRASAAFWYKRRRRIICSTARRGFCAFLWWGRSLKEPQERPVKAASHTLCTVKRRRYALAYTFAETGDWIGLTWLRTRQPTRLTTNHILTPARLDLSTSYSD